MSYVRTATLLLAATLVLSLAGRVDAQKRANGGPYINLRIGGANYGGDRDNNGGEDVWSPGVGDKINKASWALGLEFGTILSRSFSLGIGASAGNYLEIASDDIKGRPDPPSEGIGDPTFPYLAPDASKVRYTFPLLLRWMMAPKWTLSPYLGVGGNISFGTLKYIDNTSETKLAYGPSGELGLDFVVSRQSSIFADLLFNATFPDYNIDAAGDPEIEANTYGYDVLTQFTLGIRYSFRPACGPPRITSMEVPARVAIGEAAPLNAVVDDEACEPVEVSWQFGDGEAGTGRAASHMFRTPGTVTVTATAVNSAGSDSQTRTIEIFDPCPIPAEIIAINLSPNDPIINEAITFTADVRGTAPVTYNWDFGDGGTGTGARATHTYSEPGQYVVKLTCANCGGQTMKELTVTVTEFRCSDITELNSVFFGKNSSEIDGTAAALLDENVDVLAECPDLLVRLDGYTDRTERNPQKLSMARATAVEQYYIQKGVSANRLSPRGLGRDPLAGKGIDGLRNRRVDSIIVDSFE